MQMKDWAFLLGFVALALFLTFVSWDYPFISALYPRMLLACGFILSGIKMVKMLTGKHNGKRTEEMAEESETFRYPRRMWIYLGSGILYVLLMPVLGFFGVKFKTTFSVALGSTVGLHLIFVAFLQIPLPRGIIENWLF
jgi:Tripartite tricarboxylate transporter TctB family